MFLLDTHTFLWFMKDDPFLSESIRNKIMDADKVYVSIISFWEMAIKQAKGKLSLPAAISKMMLDCVEMKISVLPIKGSHLERIEHLPSIHSDPFDRPLICQAQEENLTILTKDGYIHQYDVKSMWE